MRIKGYEWDSVESNYVKTDKPKAMQQAGELDEHEERSQTSGLLYFLIPVKSDASLEAIVTLNYIFELKVFY